MRIIAGTHKGRRINPPDNLSVRPTTNKAKEALLSIISNRYFFTHKNMLDLFAGTGSIALEFASRGIQEAIAVDDNINCINFITNTSKSFKLNITPILSDGLTYTKKCKKQFNFIFADPPYRYQYYEELKEVITQKKLVKKDGLLIIEHDKETSFNDTNVEIRKYGTVHFSLFSF